MKSRRIAPFFSALLAAASFAAGTRESSLGAESFDATFFDHGTIELTLSATGSWSREEGLGLQSKTLGGNVGLGLFLTSWLEVGAKAEGSYREVGPEPGLALDEVSSLDVFGGPVLTLNFPAGRVVPFLTASIGPAYEETRTTGPGGETKEDEFGWYWDAGGGFRFFFTPWASLNLTALFRMLLFDDVPDRNSIVGMAGISLFF